MNADRLPPQNLEAERSALASCILDNAKIDEVALILTPGDFYRDSHQILCTEIFDIYQAGKPVDGVTLAERLSVKGMFSTIGGMVAMEEIMDSVPSSANAVYYAAIVREKSVLRKLIELATELLRDAYSNQVTSEDLVLSAEEKIFAIAEQDVAKDAWDAATLAEESGCRLQMRFDGQIDGIATGFTDIDEILGGFKPGQLIVLGARPSMGKTGLAANIAQNISPNGHSVMLFSIEMSHQELTDRMICSIAEIDSQKFSFPNLMDEEEKRRAYNAYGTLKAMSFFLDDAGSRTALQIAAGARRTARKNKLGLVIVDYLQLITASDDVSRQEQIASISRRLKSLAKDMAIPFLVLSQLNRESEKRDTKRPRMADLRESGAIEQDADVVLLLHRPEYYDPNDKPGIAEVIVAKNRNGPTGIIDLQFDRRCVKFNNLSRFKDPEPNGTPY